MKARQRIEASNFYRSFSVELDEEDSKELIKALRSGEEFDLLFPDYEDADEVET